jgi:UDP-glucose 4-epimerase
MAILVTGGAGYIGSVTVYLLRKHRETVVVLDDLFRGHRAALAADVPFYEGKVGDTSLVASILRAHDIRECVHFAALAYVGESCTNPALYYENNLEQGARFIHALVTGGVTRVVFSFTCATYGHATQLPITEKDPQLPVNPYGWSKLLIERVLESYERSHGVKFVALRYFNAAGATKTHGEHHEPETHLIPNVLAAAAGALPAVRVFGGTYPTADGTAIRDYIHVADLASAHLLALRYLRAGSPSIAVNLGNGKGYSVLNVIQSAKAVTGTRIKYDMQPMRRGDPPELVASADRARVVLGWHSAYPDLEQMIASAWSWYLAHPSGYSDQAHRAERSPELVARASVREILHDVRPG